jgi:malonate decarboxylase gamma subunit
MKLRALLDSLFPAGHAITVSGQTITGTATTARGAVTVLGTTEGAAISHDIALTLADGILDTVAQHPDRPLIFLVDTSGQALSRQQELLCLNGSLAHLAQCVDLARRQGHASISLVTEQAVSGGYLSFGLMADRSYACVDAQVRVMDLKAMARVTKIAYERLAELAADSPIIGPGAENYRRMGAIEAIWEPPFAGLLEAALAELDNADSINDRRMAAGLARGGRQLAAGVAAAVLAAN